MKMINRIWELLLELIFPSKKVERKLRNITLEDLSSLKKVHAHDILSLFEYKEPLIRETIKELKYRRNRKIANLMAHIVYTEILEEISDLALFENFQKGILVPIPMSKREKRERGYNQVELLIEEIIKIDNQNFDYDFNILLKTKENQRQTKLKRKERLNNIKGVFEVKKNLSGKDIILIDDVLTTGATMNEAVETLKKAGVRNVFCVVVAR